MKSFIKEIFYFTKIYKKYLGLKVYLTYLLVIISGICEGIGILMFLPLISSIAENNKDEMSKFGLYFYRFLEYLGLENKFGTIIILIIIAFLMKALIFFTAISFEAYLRGTLLKILKSRIYKASNNIRYKYFISQDSGYFLNVVNEQANRSLKAFYFLSNTINQVIITLIYFSLVFLTSPSFSLLALTSCIFLLMVFNNLNKLMRKISNKLSIENGKLSKILIQSVFSFKYTKSTSQSFYSSKKINRSINNLFKYELINGLGQGFAKTSREPIAVISVLSIISFQYFFINQNISPILISIFIFYRALNSTLGIQGWWLNTLEYIGSIELVNKSLEEQEKNIEENGNLKIKNLKRGVEFKNISFSYKSNNVNKILKNINLEILPNQTTAFVGKSGSGKSTIIDLFTLCLQPNNGEIIIDGKLSKNIEKNSWRSLIGFVPQESIIFDDTIENNITMLREENNRGNMDKLKEATHAASIDEFIESLPNGYQTKVGERGIRLSGGQRQRIAIARELYRKPKILILDEATSSLDSFSEEKINYCIDNLKHRTTVIVIAHRLSTIKNADKIYVLNNGEIKEEGTFKELSSKQESLFYKFYEKQQN